MRHAARQGGCNSCAPTRSSRSRCRRKAAREAWNQSISATGASASAHHFLGAADLAEDLLHRVRQRVVVQPVDHVLPLTLVDHQIGLLEHGEMPRNGGLGEVEVADDLADGTLLPLQQTKDLLARAVRQRLENLGQVTLFPSEVLRDTIDVRHSYSPLWAGTLPVGWQVPLHQ